MVIGLWELAGYGIVGAGLAHALVAFGGSLRQNALRSWRTRAEIEAFRARAQELVRAAEAQREKSELSWTGFRKFELTDKVPEAEGICSFYLKPHDGKPLPPFEPGQYLTFQLRIPDQNKPVVRCYSLSDAPTRRDYYRVTIKKLPPPRDKPEAPSGLSSSYFHDTLQPGDILDVRAPNGHFYLDRTKDTPVVLIGGGVGLTPMLSMLNTIYDSGSTREVWFFYGVRHGGEHAMKAHLKAVADAAPNIHVVACYSEPRPEDREGEDYHHAGHVSVDLMRRMLGAPNYEFYICGPPPMMSIITEGLEAWGVPESAINFEAFGPATVKKKTPQPEAEAGGGAAAEQAGVEVQFARSGKTVTWKPDVGSLLDLAEANGVTIDFGCRAGNCGTCLTALKSGEVDYLSEPGVPPERGSCLSCIAVPKKNVVLDA